MLILHDSPKSITQNQYHPILVEIRIWCAISNSLESPNLKVLGAGFVFHGKLV